MTVPTDSSPLVIIVSGPSGSGKSTLVEKILEMPNTMFSISCTTRRPRSAETPGKWYDFVSETEFEHMIKEGAFLEYAQVFGKNWYGTPRKWMEAARKAGKDLVLEIDVQGAEQVKKKLPASVAIFIVPPSRQVLEQRIRARGQDSEEEIARRLERARQEMQRFTEYDYVVVNEDVERAGQQVQGVVWAARNETRRQASRIQGILKTFGG